MAEEDEVEWSDAVCKEELGTTEPGENVGEANSEDEEEGTERVAFVEVVEAELRLGKE
jgi:hypothetical protein